MTPDEIRSNRAKKAAHVRHSRGTSDPTKSAREAAKRHWLALADPDGELSEAEREERAGILRREHLRRIAYRSAEVRRRNRDQRKQDERDFWVRQSV